MLQLERINDFEEALRVALDSFSAALNCATVGIVTDFNVSKGTAKIKIALQATQTDNQGNEKLIAINPLVDVPVVFMGGGGMVATFPISAGDEALVIFADRCIDAWFQSGGVQKQADPTRVHHMSDAFALVGPRSQARKIANLSTTTAQFRSLDGTTYFEIATNGRANIVAPGGLTITGPVQIDGNVSITGTTTGAGDFSITGKVTASEEGTFNNIPVSSHIHGGVQAGAGDTGPPQP